MTLYETFRRSAEKEKEKTAIIADDLKQAYSYTELLELTEQTAGCLYRQGIHPGMRVGILITGTVEEASLLFALNKIGAVARYLDFLKDINYLVHSIKASKIEALIIDEVFLPIEPVINPGEKPVIVITSRRMIRTGNCVSLNCLFESGSTAVDPCPYDKDRVTTIINSSGSTGTPKPISLTDAAINAAAVKVLKTDLINENSVILKVIPSQIGLGLITSLYTALINGNTVILNRCENSKCGLLHMLSLVGDYPRICRQYDLPEKSQLAILASPLFIRAIFYSEEVQDLSYVGSILAAGSKMTREELIELTAVGKQKNCPVLICNGYGQNELAGAAALNDNKGNEFGSAGRPTYNTVIRVVDKDTLEEKSCGETGLIIEQSDSMFSEYDGLADETREAFITLADGSVWFNTHDLGHISKTGYVYIKGRTTRVVIRFDYKLPLDDIEEKVKSNTFVHDAALIITDCSGSFEKITAFVVLTDAYKGQVTQEQILQSINEGNHLNFNEKIDELIVIDRIPVISSGKVDYALLNDLYHEMKPADV